MPEQTEKGSKGTENEETQTKVASRSIKNKNYQGTIFSLPHIAKCLLAWHVSWYRPEFRL